MISFIIPSFNSDSTICRTIDSIIKQKIDEYEIIVIDDGSTDSTKSIIAKEYGNNPLVKYFYQHNQGPGVARNYGIRIASGDWFFFIDSDDWLEESIFEEYREKLLDDSVDAVYPSMFYETDGLTKNSKMLFYSKEKLYSGKLFLNKYLLNECTAWRVSAVLYRASVIKNFNVCFPDTKNAEDFLFNVSFLEHCNNLAVLGKETLIVYRHQNSLTSNYISKLKDINRSLLDYLTGIDCSLIGQSCLSSFAIRNFIVYTIQEIFKSKRPYKEIKKEILFQYKENKSFFKKSNNKAFFNSKKKKKVYNICYFFVKHHMLRLELLFLRIACKMFPNALTR